MSDISRRIMRGDYVSKADCFRHWDEITRTMDAYPKAMDAMEAHERLMESCICEFDGGYGDDGSQVRRFPKAGCPIHAEEDAE